MSKLGKHLWVWGGAHFVYGWNQPSRQETYDEKGVKHGGV